MVPPPALQGQGREGSVPRRTFSFIGVWAGPARRRHRATGERPLAMAGGARWAERAVGLRRVGAVRACAGAPLSFLGSGAGGSRKGEAASPAPTRRRGETSARSHICTPPAPAPGRAELQSSRCAGRSLLPGTGADARVGKHLPVFQSTQISIPLLYRLSAPAASLEEHDNFCQKILPSLL